MKKTIKPMAKALAILGAVAVLAGPSAALADRTCTVSFQITSSTAPSALQFSVNHAAADDSGAFNTAACVTPDHGLTDVADNAGTAKLGLGWADATTPLSAPGAFGSCPFVISDPAATVPSGSDFSITVSDASDAEGADITGSTTMTVSVDCGTGCGNGQVESGEACDDGNLAGGDGCSSICTDTASCPATPAGGCKESTTPAKSKMSFKNDTKTPSSNVKDSGAFSWKGGAETTLADVNVGTVYSWCVFDGGQSVAGWDVPSGNGVSGVLCGAKGCSLKGDVGGVAAIKVTPGVAGKASVAVSGKSAAGNFGAPSMPFGGQVKEQFLVNNGGACFELTAASSAVNTAAAFSAVGQ